MILLRLCLLVLIIFVIVNRSGVYPLPSLPAAIGQESAGIIVGLPTDDNVLNNEDYKKRKFQLSAVIS
jgi:NADPH:quinone reductase